MTGYVALLGVSDVWLCVICLYIDLMFFAVCICIGAYLAYVGVFVVLGLLVG